ncbi:MAG: photosystem II biogenesis protein Psp29 [Paludibacter sp.]
MKIREFALSRLRNEEHFQFFTSFRDLVLIFTAAALKIELLFNLFLAAYANELESLNIIRKNVISDDLIEADDDRDNVFRGLCDAVKSALNHFNADVRTAAKRLQVVLDTYGNLAAKNYDAETGSLNSLINDLTSTYAADVAAVGLVDWVTELAAKNKAYDDLKNQRYSDEAAKTSLRMKQERVKTDALYRQLVERINALMVVEGEAGYAGFVGELNERIQGYENTIANRRGKGKKTPEVVTEN